MPPLAPLTLSTGFAAAPLRDRGGVPTPFFALGVDRLFLTNREAALPWFPDSTLNEALPYFHTPTSHKLPGTLTVLRTLEGAFALFALAFFLWTPESPARPLAVPQRVNSCTVLVRIPRGGGAQ